MNAELSKFVSTTELGLKFRWFSDALGIEWRTITEETVDQWLHVPYFRFVVMQVDAFLTDTVACQQILHNALNISVVRGLCLI